MTTMHPESDISRLASTISSSTAELERCLDEEGISIPTFDADSPVQLPQIPRVVRATNIAINACMELLDRLQGPLTCLLPLYNGTSLQAISRYGIARHVPLDGEISYADLSKACGAHASDLKQIIRFSIVYNRLFLEKRKGYVSHSAGSKLLAHDPIVEAGVGQFDEFYGSFARTVDAMMKFEGHEPNQTGFALSHNIDSTVFEYIRSRPEKAKQFSDAMKFYTGPIPACSPDSLIIGYPWTSLPDGAVVVDVGGSDGHVGRLISQSNQNIQVIVQDLPFVVEEAQASGINDGQARVELAPHDFFTPQTVVADVYLYRWVMHDWADKYVVKILRQLVPVSKKGAKVVVNESLCPDPGVLPLALERYIRYLDLMMLSIHNSRLRDEEEWQGLLQEADPRFGTVKCWTVPNAALSIIESVWEEF